MIKSMLSTRIPLLILRACTGILVPLLCEKEVVSLYACTWFAC
ncbi:hypothetical protein SEVIR_3G135950v4 [Setaria viridis]